MLRRKGSRAITVAGQSYRYAVSNAGSGPEGPVALAVTVQHGQGKGSRLRVTGLTAHRLPEEKSKWYMSRSLVGAIRPAHVECLIRRATAGGWQPAVPGPEFLLEVNNAAVLTATDDLGSPGRCD